MIPTVDTNVIDEHSWLSSSIKSIHLNLLHDSMSIHTNQFILLVIIWLDNQYYILLYCIVKYYSKLLRQTQIELNCNSLTEHSWLSSSIKSIHLNLLHDSMSIHTNQFILLVIIWLDNQYYILLYCIVKYYSKLLRQTQIELNCNSLTEHSRPSSSIKSHYLNVFHVAKSIHTNQLKYPNALNCFITTNKPTKQWLFYHPPRQHLIYEM